MAKIDLRKLEKKILGLQEGQERLLRLAKIQRRPDMATYYEGVLCGLSKARCLILEMGEKQNDNN